MIYIYKVGLLSQPPIQGFLIVTLNEMRGKTKDNHHYFKTNLLRKKAFKLPNSLIPLAIKKHFIEIGNSQSFVLNAQQV